jgi:hypothetical protein
MIITLRRDIHELDSIYCPYKLTRQHRWLVMLDAHDSQLPRRQRHPPAQIQTD